MSVIVYQFQTVKFIQMMSLTCGLFTQVSGSGPLGPLVIKPSAFYKTAEICRNKTLEEITLPYGNTIVQVYAPTFRHEASEVDRFYEQLQEIMEQIPQKDILIVQGGGNANCLHFNIYEQENSILGFSESEKKAEFLDIFILMSI